MTDQATRLIYERKLSEANETIARFEKHMTDEQKTELEGCKNSMVEALSGGDWTKFGIAFGMLWNKLDQVISAIKDGNTQLRTIANRRR